MPREPDRYSKYDDFEGAPLHVFNAALRKWHSNRADAAHTVASVIIAGGRHFPGTPRLGKYNHHMINGVRVK